MAKAKNKDFFQKLKSSYNIDLNHTKNKNEELNIN
jgi:hypothetical protein